MRGFSPLGFSPLGFSPPPLAIGIGKGEYFSSLYSTRLRRNSSDSTLFALHPFNLLHRIHHKPSNV
jgi:hypothetical protein